MAVTITDAARSCLVVLAIATAGCRGDAEPPDGAATERISSTCERLVPEVTKQRLWLAALAEPDQFAWCAHTLGRSVFWPSTPASLDGDIDDMCGKLARGARGACASIGELASPHAPPTPDAWRGMGVGRPFEVDVRADELAVSYELSMSEWYVGRRSRDSGWTTVGPLHLERGRVNLRGGVAHWVTPEGDLARIGDNGTVAVRTAALPVGEPSYSFETGVTAGAVARGDAEFVFWRWTTADGPADRRSWSAPCSRLAFALIESGSATMDAVCAGDDGVTIATSIGGTGELMESQHTLHDTRLIMTRCAADGGRRWIISSSGEVLTASGAGAWSTIRSPLPDNSSSVVACHGDHLYRAWLTGLQLSVVRCGPGGCEPTRTTRWGVGLLSLALGAGARGAGIVAHLGDDHSVVGEWPESSDIPRWTGVYRRGYVDISAWWLGDVWATGPALR